MGALRRVIRETCGCRNPKTMAGDRQVTCLKMGDIAGLDQIYHEGLPK
jgi:hypothetical protein